MTNDNLLNLIRANSGRIIDAISTWAAWEIWMQVELTIIFMRNQLQVARELKYPDSNNYLDARVADSQGAYAIELKVESATNSGSAILNAILADKVKIASYNVVNTTKWVLGIAYSAEAKYALRTFAANFVNKAIYAEENSLGILVVTV